MSEPRSRRATLRAAGTAGLAALSGCLFGFASGGSGFELTLERLGSALGPALSSNRSELTDEQAAIVGDLATNGTAAWHGTPPLADGAVLRIDGAFYRVTAADTGTETTTRPALYARHLEERSTEAGVPVERYDGTAEAAVRRAIALAERDRGEPFTFDSDVAVPASLTPDPEHEVVTLDGEAYRLRLAERTVDADRFEYAWSELRTSVAVEEAIRDQYDVVDVAHAGLSEDARSILRTARDDPPYVGYREYSGAESEVLDVLGVRSDDPVDSTARLYFERVYYEADVQFVFSD